MAGASSLSHVLLCAGTVAQWAATSPDEWRARINVVAQAAIGGGAAWVTLVPTAAGTALDAESVREQLMSACGGVRYAEKIVMLPTGGVTVIVDVCADGKERIAAGATAVAASGEITEDRLAAALSAPAPNEPDLVIVLGPATQMPASLVWELAYAELVFFDADWHALDAEHLEMAIDDFTRRDRRFGGVDS